MEPFCINMKLFGVDGGMITWNYYYYILVLEPLRKNSTHRKLEGNTTL